MFSLAILRRGGLGAACFMSPVAAEVQAICDDRPSCWMSLRVNSRCPTAQTLHRILREAKRSCAQGKWPYLSDKFAFLPEVLPNDFPFNSQQLRRCGGVPQVLEILQGPNHLFIARDLDQLRVLGAGVTV